MHGEGADDASRTPLGTAVLALVRRDPDLGERSLTRALAAEGATQGRVYRILQRHGLETVAKRRRWAEGSRATAGDRDEPRASATASAPDDGAGAASGAEAAGPGAPVVGEGAGAAEALAPAPTRPGPPPAGGAPLAAALPALPPQLQASARDLAARLEPYFAGGMAHVFHAEDAVDFAAPLTVVHAADAEAADSRLGALKMILDGGAVREMLEAEGSAGRRYTAVYFEEGQRLLQNPHMRRYVADLFTAIRKRNGMAMLATNSTQALFERDGDVTKAGPVWQNARGKVLLAMSREAVEDVKGHGTMPQGVVGLLEGLRAADHAAVLEWDGRYELVRMDVPGEEAGLYRTRGLRAAVPTGTGPGARASTWAGRR